PGEVLVSGHVQPALTGAFVLETQPSIRVKGQSEPIPVAKLIRRVEEAESAAHSGPLIGRDSELAQLKDFAVPIFSGEFAGIAHVYGEPGIGKTRLIHELRQQLTKEHDLGWFTCPAEQLVRQSLHPFKYFLGKHFKQDSAASEMENKARFEEVFVGILA